MLLTSLSSRCSGAPSHHSLKVCVAPEISEGRLAHRVEQLLVQVILRPDQHFEQARQPRLLLLHAHLQSVQLTRRPASYGITGDGLRMYTGACGLNNASTALPCLPVLNEIYTYY